MNAPDRRQRVFLHIGLPKTGTTYLQDRLWRNRDAARREGLLYPGDTLREAHFHAAVHLQPDRYLDWVDPQHDGAWDRLIDQVREWPGSSLISHELLATASDRVAARAVASLDFAEVHVVCTARDLARQIPSVWQEDIKNQFTITLAEFLTSIRTRNGRHDLFWEFQHLPRILRTWGRDLPAHRVHLVTVPPRSSSPDALWERFTMALGVPFGRLRRGVPAINDSLDAAQIEVLRRINTGVKGRIAWPRYESVVKDLLIGKTFLATPHRQAPTLPPEKLPWLQEITDEFIADILAAGYHVVGDLTDLRPRPALKDTPIEASVDDMLAVAVDALTKIVLAMPEPDPATARTAPHRVVSLLRDRRHRLRKAISARKRSL